jgi:hypothetical protein
METTLWTTASIVSCHSGESPAPSGNAAGTYEPSSISKSSSETLDWRSIATSGVLSPAEVLPLLREERSCFCGRSSPDNGGCLRLVRGDVRVGAPPLVLLSPAAIVLSASCAVLGLDLAEEYVRRAVYLWWMNSRRFWRRRRVFEAIGDGDFEDEAREERFVRRL